MCIVNDDGTLDNNDCDNDNTVRPFWKNVSKSKLLLKSVRFLQKSVLPFLSRINTKVYFMYELVTSFKNLYRAYKKSKSGKGYKRSSAKFEIMALEGILMLQARLKNKTYRVSGYNQFEVTRPKRRVIKAGSFQDKIVQHSLCDNVLAPVLYKLFIWENFAGQEGKGTLFGLDCLRDSMMEFHRECDDGWILKCDITKFFYNIDHGILKRKLRQHIDNQDILWLCDAFINSTENPGLPLGNQISQSFALLYLNDLDHYIKNDLGIKHYGRYMDDFYLIHESKDYLKCCKKMIEQHVEGLKLTLNGKTQIMPFKNGVDFLGFHTYITKTGVPIRKLKNENKRAAQKKYRRMAKLVKVGKLPPEQLWKSYKSWKAHADKGNCKKLIHNMDQMIDGILKQED